MSFNELKDMATTSFKPIFLPSNYTHCPTKLTLIIITFMPFFKAVILFF